MSDKYESAWRESKPKFATKGFIQWKQEGDWCEGPIVDVWKGRYAHWHVNILLRDFELHHVRARGKKADFAREEDMWVTVGKGDVVTVVLSHTQLKGRVEEKHIGYDIRFVYEGWVEGRTGLKMKAFTVLMRPPPGQEPGRLEDY